MRRTYVVNDRSVLKNVVAFVAVVLGMTLAFSSYGSDEVGAFDQYSEGCGNDTSRTIGFEGSEWNLPHNPSPPSQTLKAPFIAGFEEWTVNGPKTWSGAAAFVDDPNDTIDLDFVPSSWLNGAGALANCQIEEIWYNVNNVAAWQNSSWDNLKGLSAHEWGHVWGLGHSGKDDSTGGDNPPTMATCIANGAARASLSQDEYAAGEYLTDGGSLTSVTANSSFESGTVHWKNYGNISVSSINGGVDGSPKAGLISAAALNWYSIVSTTRVTDLQQLQGDGNVTGDSFMARVNYRDWGAENKGVIKFRVRARGVIYQDGNDNGCNFYGDIKNSVQHVGDWVEVARLCYPKFLPNAAYKYCDLPTATNSGNTITVPTNGLPSQGSVGSSDYPDAVDVRVHVHNRVYVAGGSASNPADRRPVAVDRLRVEYDF